MVLGWRKFFCGEGVEQLVDDALVDIGKIGYLAFDVRWTAEIVECTVVDEDVKMVWDIVVLEA